MQYYVCKNMSTKCFGAGFAILIISRNLLTAEKETLFELLIKVRRVFYTSPGWVWISVGT